MPLQPCARQSMPRMMGKLRFLLGSSNVQRGWTIERYKAREQEWKSGGWMNYEPVTVCVWCVVLVTDYFASLFFSSLDSVSSPEFALHFYPQLDRESRKAGKKSKFTFIAHLTLFSCRLVSSRVVSFSFSFSSSSFANISFNK